MYIKITVQTLVAISHLSKEIVKYSREMLVLSLGTGAAKKHSNYSARRASRWGLFDWIFEDGKTPIIDVYSDASSDLVDFHVCTLFQCSGCKDNYL